MNNKEFDDFLERGWEYGADLFHQDKIYHIQCDYDKDIRKYNLQIFSFKAQKYGSHSFSAYVNSQNKYVDYNVIVDELFDTREAAKQRCLSGKFFGGLDFWKIGDKFEWLDDDGPSIVVD